MHNQELKKDFVSRVGNHLHGWVKAQWVNMRATDMDTWLDLLNEELDEFDVARLFQQWIRGELDTSLLPGD